MVPTSKTIKSLFARSGNRCAFSNCFVPLVEENDIVTGEVCHIKARNARGPRYDPSQTDAERNDSANLILLCARHHKIVDDAPATHSVQILLAMKRERELVGEITITSAIARRAELLRKNFVINVRGDLSVPAIHAQNVTIKNAGHSKIKITLPDDVVGGSSPHRAYLKYLIDRYQQFAKAQKDREFKFSVVPVNQARIQSRLGPDSPVSIPGRCAFYAGEDRPYYCWPSTKETGKALI
jgi:hypothetical protein